MSVYRSALPRFFLALSFCLLAACSTHRHLGEDTWPQTMPAREDFLAVYAADEGNSAIQTEEEYLLWIVRFYQGWELYRRGWTKMTEELVSQLHDPSQAPEVREKIGIVGFKMSSEWAKKADTRTIYLRHVSVWGNALLESIERDDALNLVNRVDQDIDDLIARRITPDLISAERYYPSDPDNPFL